MSDVGSHVNLAMFYGELLSNGEPYPFSMKSAKEYQRLSLEITDALLRESVVVRTEEVDTEGKNCVSQLRKVYLLDTDLLAAALRDRQAMDQVETADTTSRGDA